MRHVYSMLILLTITNLYSASPLSLTEIEKEVAFLEHQAKVQAEKISNIETQIGDLHRYDHKLNKRVQKLNKRLLEHNLRK